MKQKQYILFGLIIGLIICLDQITKSYIHTHFFLGQSLDVIPDFFNITYVRNKGAAFGILSTAPELFRTLFFLSLPPLAVLFVFQILRNVPPQDRIQTVALSGIAGGALGNYIDRIKLGYVVDFLDFHYKGIYSWPAFNVADMAIVGGVCLLFYLMTQEKKQKRNKS